MKKRKNHIVNQTQLVNNPNLSYLTPHHGNQSLEIIRQVYSCGQIFSNLITFRYMNNAIPYKSTMNEGSPFEFSTFKGQLL